MGTVLSNYELHQLLMATANAARKAVEDNPVLADYELRVEHPQPPIKAESPGK